MLDSLPIGVDNLAASLRQKPGDELDEVAALTFSRRVDPPGDQVQSIVGLDHSGLSRRLRRTPFLPLDPAHLLTTTTAADLHIVQGCRTRRPVQDEKVALEAKRRSDEERIALVAQVF